MLKCLYRLLQIDDMDTVALGENIGLHCRVPFMGSMPKMNTAFKKRFHRDNTHWTYSFAFFLPLPSSQSGTAEAARTAWSGNVWDIAP